MQNSISVLSLELETLSKVKKHDDKIASIAAIDIIVSRLHTYASPIIIVEKNKF